jgi:hypothetical protein
MPVVICHLSADGHADGNQRLSPRSAGFDIGLWRSSVSGRRLKSYSQSMIYSVTLSPDDKDFVIFNDKDLHPQISRAFSIQPPIRCSSMALQLGKREMCKVTPFGLSSFTSIAVGS